MYLCVCVCIYLYTHITTAELSVVMTLTALCRLWVYSVCFHFKRVDVKSGYLWNIYLSLFIDLFLIRHFSFCTETVPNSDVNTEVRNEPWLWCTVKPPIITRCLHPSAPSCHSGPSVYPCVCAVASSQHSCFIRSICSLLSGSLCAATQVQLLCSPVAVISELRGIVISSPQLSSPLPP